MKKYFGNIQTLLIVALVVIIILLRSCNNNSVPTEPTVITKVEVKYDTITKYVPEYVPKLITKVEYVHDTVVRTQPIDTVAILKDYFATYVYEDHQELDSLNITIKDSVTQNKIISRSIAYDLIYPTTTITKEIYLNNKEFYYGLNLNGKSDQLNYLGGSILYRTKSKQIYSVGLGVNQNMEPVISAGLYWKIGK
jgi:hypothetical protein